AMLPFAPTGTPLLVKKLLPNVLVADGPVNELNTSTGLLGAAASNSASVGRRFSANCAGVHPPIAVMNSPAFTGLVRAPIAAGMSRTRGGVRSARAGAGSKPEPQEGFVFADRPGTGRAPAEIDHLHAAAAIGPSLVTDRRELPVLDRHGRYDRIASIEGVNLSIGQLDIARACAIVSVARESRSDHRHTRQQRRRN